MENIRIQTRQEKQPRSQLNYYIATAVTPIGEVGTFEYHFDPKAKKWELEEIRVVEGNQRRGIGKRLLADFVEKHPGQPVQGTVIHDDTYNLLAREYGSLVPEEGNFVVPLEKLPEIPIVRILTSGGIQVESVEIKKIHDEDFPDYDLSISISGHTNPKMTP